MKTHAKAFTLIELLVVISVIAILAALTFPAVKAAKLSMMRARAKSGLMQVETAIERYKDKLGYYPPDNPLTGNADSYALNQLYYELLGTTNSSGTYHTLDDSAETIRDTPAAFRRAFGVASDLRSFMNLARGGSGDQAPSGIAFMPGLKAGQFLSITNGASTVPVCTVLGSGLDGPLLYHNVQQEKINPWRYNSSNPRYNPKTFDLWIDVIAGDKTNRICNWSEKPLVVGAPYN